ncbi:hypothetical protein F442_22424, partial [Phytophthora nicotianae P10297]
MIALSSKSKVIKATRPAQKSSERHVYANPYEPSQCAILSLAVHLFCCPERLVGGKQQLFIGDDNKNRFGRMLRRVISGLTDDEIDILSCKPTDI